MSKPPRKPAAVRSAWIRLRQLRIGGASVGALAAGAIALIFLLGLGIPWQPVHADFYGFADYFDYSWMLVLHDALATGKQFGRQIILPYGPTGFLAAPVYHPQTYLLLLISRAAIMVAVFRGLWSAAQKFIRHPLAAGAWFTSIILLMSASPDHFFPVCACLLLVSYFSVNDRTPRADTIALTIVLAAASLAKMNLLLQSATVVGAISVDQLYRRGARGLLIPLVYMGCICLFYLACRQSPASVGAFIWGWAQVAGGHVDAVSIPGPDIEVALYGFIAGLVLIAVVDLYWRKLGRAAALPVLALAGLFLLLYKHSFVRQDFAHATIGPMAALAVAVVYTPLLWRSAGGRGRQALCVSILVLGGIVASSSITGNSPGGTQSDSNLFDYAWGQVRATGRGWLAAARDISDSSRLRRDWEADRAAARQANPISEQAVAGTVDVYPHRQDVLFAYGFNYAPRPATQSLIATAPSLARLDAAHLLTPAAAESILFDIELVDYNFPSALDGLSWPNLLTRYDIVDDGGAFLVLRRSAAPRSYTLAPATTLHGNFDEPLNLPTSSAGPLWAKFHLKRRTGGRLVAAIYKPPLVGISVKTRVMPPGRDALPFRFLPSLAEEGFLLSPLIENRREFSTLASPTWQKDLSAKDVVSLTIAVGDGSYKDWFEREYDVALFYLEFPRQKSPLHTAVSGRQSRLNHRNSPIFQPMRNKIEAFERTPGRYWE